MLASAGFDRRLLLWDVQRFEQGRLGPVAGSEGGHSDSICARALALFYFARHSSKSPFLCAPLSLSDHLHPPLFFPSSRRRARHEPCRHSHCDRFGGYRGTYYYADGTLTHAHAHMHARHASLTCRCIRVCALSLCVCVCAGPFMGPSGSEHQPEATWAFGYSMLMCCCAAVLWCCACCAVVLWCCGAAVLCLLCCAACCGAVLCLCVCVCVRAHLSHNALFFTVLVCVCCALFRCAA